jgi:hypothetical protein
MCVLSLFPCVLCSVLTSSSSIACLTAAASEMKSLKIQTHQQTTHTQRNTKSIQSTNQSSAITTSSVISYASTQLISPPSSPTSVCSTQSHHSPILPISTHVEYDDDAIVSTVSQQLDALYEALHVSHVPHVLPCRDVQQHSIESFITNKLSQRSAGALYICGSPGVGRI